MRGLAPIPQMDKILLDIQDYHTTIKEAGEISRDANVKHLLIYHAIPTPRNKIMEDVFLGRLLAYLILTLFQMMEQG